MLVYHPRKRFKAGRFQNFETIKEKQGSAYLYNETVSTSTGPQTLKGDLKSENHNRFDKTGISVRMQMQMGTFYSGCPSRRWTH
jgi:hypothetical protein